MFVLPVGYNSAGAIIVRSFRRVVAVGTGYTSGILVGRVEYKFVDVGECGDFRLWCGVGTRSVGDGQCSTTAHLFGAL